jgi:hypothetical protein
MKDEIKEIERILATSGKYITYAERCYVLDYITNLQEENERLKETIENLTTMTVNGDRTQIKNTAQYKLDIYKSRNEKAIEYNKEVLTWWTNEDITDEIAETNLKILNGGDEEC